MLRDVPRSKWEAKLRSWGCKPLEGKGPLNTAEWWRGPHGIFTVPIEGDDETCEFWALQKLCKIFGTNPDEFHPTN